MTSACFRARFMAVAAGFLAAYHLLRCAARLFRAAGIGPAGVSQGRHREETQQ
ncbi:MAG: hypothetical protein JNL13_14700 [Chitinophagaceae bacterium]|nr:hypothetical protein [Chitinophagaceae bacterium]